MGKPLMLVFLLFAANLDAAYPTTPNKISKQFETDFKGTVDQQYRAESIPGKCDEMKICKLYYNIFRVCREIEKCTL